jgi:SHS2 domain-containing protein
MPCNEADAARSDCLNGKKMAIRIENKNRKNVRVNVLEKNLYIAENELIIMSPFFYE